MTLEPRMFKRSRSEKVTPASTRQVPGPWKGLPATGPPPGPDMANARTHVLGSGVLDVLDSARAGAPGRDRTCDQVLRRHLLYPLSYGRSATDHRIHRARGIRAAPVRGTRAEVSRRARPRGSRSPLRWSRRSSST